ncbi:MAG: hypothetical protein CL431_05180 [Acidimicrobiaceae bacterium]|nr:hypothetical protein [Acidimicrobiaceae bacterium]|tara:strand:- start:7450 stop:8226 length:777 start_codon:yes stop_codon:yes gene_type:complete
MAEIDPRIQERRIEIIRAKGKRRLRILLMFILLILLSVAGLFISKSSLLDVDEIVIVGAEGELAEAILNQANISKSKPILEVDVTAVTSRIEEIPYINEARINRSFGGKITILVSLRKPTVVLQNFGDWLLIDSEGRLLERISEMSPSLRYPVIEGNFSDLQIGEWLPEQALSAVELANNLPPVLLADTSSILPGEEIELVLFGQGKVLFGNNQALESKIVAVSTILEQVNLAGLIHIDVRTPDKPVLCRSLECSYDS